MLLLILFCVRIDVLEQCYQMGIDPVHEKDLVYIAMEALKAPLPESWRPMYVWRKGRIEDEGDTYTCTLYMLM